MILSKHTFLFGNKKEQIDLRRKRTNCSEKIRVNLLKMCYE